MKNTRNFWPLGILAVIVIGVILLVILVRLSIKDPVIDDNAYFEKYDEVDKNINAFMRDTNEFETDYGVWMGANEKPLEDAAHKPLAPYYVKGRRDKLKKMPKTELYVNAPNRIFVLLRPLKSPSPISDLKVNLFLSRYHMQKETLEFKDLPCDADGLCASDVFNLDVGGRWKVVLQLEYVQNNQKKKVYLEKEFFAGMRE